MQLFQGFLSRGSGRGASHGLWSWSLPLQRAGAGVSESAESGRGESLPPVLQHHCRPPHGPGRGSAPSQTTGPRRPLPRDAPAPFAAFPRLPRCCTARHPQTRSPRRAKSLEISTAARDRYPAPGFSSLPARTLAPHPSRRRKELALIS